MSIIACSIDKCEKPKRGKHGWCGAHWVAWKQHGDPTINLKSTGPKPCVMEACENFAYGKGLCVKHWTRKRRNGDPSIVHPRARSGSGNPNWKGDALGYFGAHDRVHSARGPAKNYLCVDCGKAAQHWSYNHADPNEKTEQLGTGGLSPFSLDPTNYDPRCVPCHGAFDANK